MKRARINLRLRDDEKQLFEQHAYTHHISLSDLLRTATHHYIQNVSTTPVSTKQKG